jgi:hypothetical protein
MSAVPTGCLWAARLGGGAPGITEPKRASMGCKRSATKASLLARTAPQGHDV